MENGETIRFPLVPSYFPLHTYLNSLERLATLIANLKVNELAKHKSLWEPAVSEPSANKKQKKMQYSSILFLTLRFIKTRLYLHYFRPHFLSLSLSLITHSILSQSTVSNLDFLRPPVEKAKYLSRIFQPIKPITTDVVKQNFPFLNWPDNIIFVIQPNTFLLLILFLSKFLFLFTSSEYPLSRKSKSLFSYYSYLIQTPIRFNANFSTFHQILQIRFLPALSPKIHTQYATN